MRLLQEAMNLIGAALLQLAVGLLIEELTFAGLVRLILAPRPESGKTRERNHPAHHNPDKGERPCSH